MNKKPMLNLQLDEYERNYVKQYLKTNLRLIIVSIIILVLFVRNVVLPNNISFYAFRLFGDYYYGSQPFAHFNQLFITVCLLSFVLPLYQFRFLMKRSSCDLYLSLPISRERLYKLHYMIGALLLVCITLFESIFVLYDSAIAYGITATTLLAILLFCILGLCLYSFFTMIVVRCNTMLDAIVVTALFTIVPLLLHQAIQSFFIAVEDGVLVSAVSVARGSFYNQISQLITSFLSLPWLLHLWVYAADRGEYTISLGMLLICTLYWLVLGIACYIWGKQYFIRSKSENREQRTTTFFTYPLLIPAFAFVMLLRFGKGTYAVPWIIIIGIVYVIAQFFAQRSIRISFKKILLYGIMVVLITGSYQLCVQTNLFHTIQEVPNIEDVTAVTVHVDLYDSDQIDPTILNASSEYMIYDKDLIQSVINTNEEMMKKLKAEGYLHEGVYGSIDISYNNGEYPFMVRTYFISNEKEMEYAQSLADEWIKQGIVIRTDQGE